MSDWKNELARYLTGEAEVYDADTFYLKQKYFFADTGYNILGQYQGTDYDYYIWVGIQAPEGYGLTEVRNNISNIAREHSSWFSGVKLLKAWSMNGRSGLIFGANKAPDAFATKIKSLVKTNKQPEGGYDWVKYLVAGAAVLAIILTVVLIAKKR